MLMRVTQMLADNRTQSVLLNNENIISIIPWQSGAYVRDTSGKIMQTAENPEWFAINWNWAGNVAR